MIVVTVRPREVKQLPIIERTRKRGWPQEPEPWRFTEAWGKGVYVFALAVIDVLLWLIATDAAKGWS